MANGDTTLERLDERVKFMRAQLDEQEKTVRELRRDLDEMRHRHQGLADSMLRLVAEAKQFTADQVKTVLKMIEAFESETTDRREFDRAVKVSVITMVVSALLFSVVAPWVQHLLIGAH